MTSRKHSPQAKFEFRVRSQLNPKGDPRGGCRTFQIDNASGLWFRRSVRWARPPNDRRDAPMVAGLFARWIEVIPKYRLDLVSRTPPSCRWRAAVAMVAHPCARIATIVPRRRRRTPASDHEAGQQAYGESLDHLTLHLVRRRHSRKKWCADRRDQVDLHRRASHLIETASVLSFKQTRVVDALISMPCHSIDPHDSIWLPRSMKDSAVKFFNSV